MNNNNQQYDIIDSTIGTLIIIFIALPTAFAFFALGWNAISAYIPSWEYWLAAANLIFWYNAGCAIYKKFKKQ